MVRAESKSAATTKSNDSRTPDTKADGSSKKAAVRGMDYASGVAALSPDGKGAGSPDVITPPADRLAGCDTSKAHLEYDYEEVQWDADGKCTQYRRTHRYYHVPGDNKSSRDKLNTIENGGRGELISATLYRAKDKAGTLWWSYVDERPAIDTVPIKCPGDGAFDGMIDTPMASGTVTIDYNTEQDADRLDLFEDGGKALFSTGTAVSTKPKDAPALGKAGVVSSGPLAFTTVGKQLHLVVTPSNPASLWEVTLTFRTIKHDTFSSDARYGPIDADNRDLR